MENQESEGAKARLDEISTEWAIVRDPARFVLRYAPAIHRYLGALIHNRHDVEEVAQEFFLRVTRHGFARTKQSGGRFRDYLRAAVRNAALNHLRRGRPLRPADSAILLAGVPDKSQAAADQAWLAEWRRCVFDRACRALEKYQRRSPGNLSYTVLRLLAEHPRDDTRTLAARTSALIGRPLRADAFRKQVSRARYLLAKLLVKEVAQTLDDPTPERIKEELIALALWEYIRDFLPAHRRSPQNE